MFFLISFAVTLIGATLNIVVARPSSPFVFVEISVTWFCGVFYGVTTLLAGVQHVFHSEKIAALIGWQSNGFQRELGWMEIGLGIAGLMAVGLRGTILIAPILIGGVLFGGASLVHAQEMRTAHNFHPGNAGLVFYIDIVVALVSGFLLAAYLLLH